MMGKATWRSSLLLSLGFALAAAPANAALVLHYNLDEPLGTTGVGSVADSSTSNIDATPTAGVTFGEAALASGTSVEFPGTNNSVSSTSATTNTDIGIDANNPRTISLWFNADDIRHQMRLLGMGSGAAGAFQLTLENGGNSGNQNRFGLRYGNGNVFFNSDNSNTVFALDTTYHVAMTYDGTQIDDNWADNNGVSVFVNGVQITSRAAGNGNNLPQNLNTASDEVWVGSSPGGGNAFDGHLDDVQIYDEALTPAQINFLFNNPGSVIPEPSAFALASLGALGLLARRRRKGH